MKKNEGIDGLFCGSDVIAAEAIQAAVELGISIPDRLKIIGYDDTLLSELTMPKITTIHQPVKEMAEMCIDLIDKKNNGDFVPARTIFHVSLVSRGTA